MAAHKQTCVRVRNGRLDGQIFPIRKKGVTLVGRAPASHIVLPHPDVSSIHCVLAPDRRANGLLLIDVRSRAGTRVGGDPVAKHVLHMGDVVSIGPFELELTDATASHPLAGPQHIGSNGHPVFELAPRRSRGNDEPFATGWVTVIGRSRLADLRVRDPLASRFHCLIALDTTEEGVLPFAIDLRSHGRTYVNDHAIHRKHLRPGDVLTVGLTEFELREPPAQAEEAGQEAPEAPTGFPCSDSGEPHPPESAVGLGPATPSAPRRPAIRHSVASAQEEGSGAEPDVSSSPVAPPVPEEGASRSQGDEPSLLFPGGDEAEAPLHAPTPVAREQGSHDSPKPHEPTVAPGEPDATESSAPLAAEGLDEDAPAVLAPDVVQAWPSEMSDVDEVDGVVPAGPGTAGEEGAGSPLDDPSAAVESATSGREDEEPATAFSYPASQEEPLHGPDPGLTMDLAPEEPANERSAGDASERPSGHARTDLPVMQPEEARWEETPPEADEPADASELSAEQEMHPPELVAASIDDASSQREEPTSPGADVVSAEPGTPFPDAAVEDVDDPDPVGVDIDPVEQPESIPPPAESGAESCHIDVQAQGRSVLLPTTAPRRPIRRRLVGRVLGLAVCLAGSAASIALACFLVRPQYQAAATIEVRPAVTVRAEGGERHEVFAAYFDTQMAKVRSDAVLRRALDEAPTAHVVQGRARGEALGVLRDTLQVQRLGASYLFAVRLSAQTPQGLADTVNAIARACEAEAQEDQRRATSRQRQRLENERKRLHGEVDGKAAALARLRELLASMSTSGVEGSGREATTAVEQALIDVQAKQASLRTRLDERHATLKARRAETRTAEIEKVLGGDAEVRRLTALRDSVAQKRQSAQIESVAPEPVDLERQVSQDPRVTALRQELGRKHRLLDRMLEAAARGGSTSESDASPTIPCGLIAAALADHPEAQRLASLRDELSQALKRELDADQADRRPPAMKGGSTLRVDSLRSHLLTIQCQLQEYGSQALEATRTAVAALPARLAQEQSRAREQILARLRRTADERTAALRGQLHSLDEQIDQRRGEVRPRVAARTESAALEPILADIKTLGAEVVACDASEGALRGLLARHSSRRATAEQASWEARDLENGLGQAREALARTERDLLDLDVMATAPGVVTIASQAIEPTGPEPYVARRAPYSAAGIVLACLLAAMTSRLVTRRHD